MSSIFKLIQGQLQNISSSERPDPTVNKGRLVWNNDSNRLEYSNGVSWQPVDLPSDGILYDNILSMRGATPPSDGTTVLLKGYYTIGDGGEGQFFWSASSSEDENGGTIIKSSVSGTGRWVRMARITGRLDVRWFGAHGNGSSHPLSDHFSSLSDAQTVYPHAISLTNETDWSAIQAAVNVSSIPYPTSTEPFARGGTIWFPKGIYFCDQNTNVEQKLGVALRGATGISVPGVGRNAEATIVYTAATQWKNLYNQGSIISFRSTFGCGIENLGVQYSDPSYTGVPVDFSHYGGATSPGDYGTVSLTGTTATRDIGRWDDDGWTGEMPFNLHGSLSNNGNKGTVSGISSDGLILTIVGASFTTESVSNTVFYVNASDSQKGFVRRCYIGGGHGIDTAVDPLSRACISLWGAIDCQIEDNMFSITRGGVRMQEYAHGSFAYSNAHEITGCQFGYCQNAIMNAGQMCYTAGNVFESTAGFMEHAYFDDYPHSNASVENHLDFDATNKYITRSSGSWATDGWQVGYNVNITTLIGIGNAGNRGFVVNVDVFSDGKTMEVSGALVAETGQTKYTVYDDDHDIETACSEGDTFTFDNSANTITRVTGDWINDGWQTGTSQMNGADVISPGSGGGGGFPDIIGVTSKVLTLSPGMPFNTASTSARLYFTVGPQFLTIETSWFGDQFLSSVWIEVQGAAGLKIHNNFFSGDTRALRVRELGISGLSYVNNLAECAREPILFEGLGNPAGVVIGPTSRGIPAKKYVRFRSTYPASNIVMQGGAPNDANTPYQIYDDLYAAWRLRLGSGVNALFQGGDVEAEDIGKGFVLKSPDGSRWRIIVNNSGVVSTTAL